MAAKVEHGNNIISNTSSSITTTTSKSHFHTSLSLLTALSLVGLVDTLYLTWVKLNINNNSGQSLLFCDNTDSSCHSVLESSYSTIHIGTDIHIPLSLLGVISYSLTSMTSFVFLSSSSTYLMPTALLIQTTAMATFSTFYMYILFFILHQSCPYCILSAVVSITMASICWYTTISQQQHQESSSISTTTLDHTDSNTDISIQMIYNIQDEKEEDATIPTSSPSSSSSSSILRIPTNIIYGITSLLTTTVVAWLLLFVPTSTPTSIATSSSSQPEILNKQEKIYYSPPTITTTSTPDILLLGKQLQSLDARMYGAYWCSHCFEQKQRLGKEIFEGSSPLVQYIECDAEGYSNQRKICKDVKKIPGYPTWEINGQLYPGELYIDELQAIVKDILDSKKEGTKDL